VPELSCQSGTLIVDTAGCTGMRSRPPAGLLTWTFSVAGMGQPAGGTDRPEEQAPDTELIRSMRMRLRFHPLKSPTHRYRPCAPVPIRGTIPGPAPSRSPRFRPKYSCPPTHRVERAKRSDQTLDRGLVTIVSLTQTVRIWLEPGSH